MAKINKKLTSLLETTSPEKMKELAALCRESADALRKTSELLVQASNAFDNGQLLEGCKLIEKAEEAVSKS